MSKRKEIVGEEPAWKKRERDGRAQARRNKLWMAIGIVAGLAIVTFFVVILVRGFGARTARKPAKVKELHTISHVQKRIVTKDGKTERYISFRIGNVPADKKVDEKTYNSLKDGQEFLVTYERNSFFDARIIRWERPKLMKPEGGH